MNSALVKIDVAAHITRKPVPVLFAMADGGDLVDRALLWVFDLSNGEQGARRELRFWEPELQTRANPDPTKHNKYCGWELDWVIKKVLPEKRAAFHAGEVDYLFQIRPRTRIDFTELNGEMKQGRNFYSRQVLADFLTRRWLHSRPTATLPGNHNGEVAASRGVPSGSHSTGATLPTAPVTFPPRAAARSSADTNKQTTHAGKI
jgi:hypothetical protein